MYKIWLDCASCLGLTELVQSLELLATNASAMGLLEEEDEGPWSYGPGSGPHRSCWQWSLQCSAGAQQVAGTLLSHSSDSTELQPRWINFSSSYFLFPLHLLFSSLFIILPRLWFPLSISEVTYEPHLCECSQHVVQTG